MSNINRDGAITPPVNSNADGLAVAKDLTKIAELSVGDYQGQTVVLLKDDTAGANQHRFVPAILIFVIRYGSCGGCDWFKEFYGGTITYKDCIDAFRGSKPVFIYPFDDFCEMPADKLHSLLLDPDGGYQTMTPEYGWTIDAAADLIQKARRVPTANQPEREVEEGVDTTK